METKLLADALNTFSEIIRGQRHWDDIRGELLRECRDLFNAQVCALFLVRGDYIELEDHIGYTMADGPQIPLTTLKEKLRYRLGPRLENGTCYDGITGKVASTGEEFSLIAPASSTADPSWSGKPDRLGIWSETRPFSCMFAVPLKIGGDVIGVLKVENKRGPKGDQAFFDEVDKAVLRALGNFFSIAVKFSYFRGLPYEELFATTIEWLDKFDRQNLYRHLVEFCARLFRADVCALYVRTERNGEPRMALVAGRLRNGDSMDPADLEEAGTDSTYRIGRGSDGNYDGITGQIATTGKSIKIDKYEEIGRPPGVIGKWDQIVWGGDPASSFLCMIGVPLRVKSRPDPIGILKVERATRIDGGEVFHDQDLDILTQAAAAVAIAVSRILSTGSKLMPGREHEYQLTRRRAEEFRYKVLGGVVIRHLMTSICQSDLEYFRHRKDVRKLDERLPMPLGHETVGEILRTAPNARDANGAKIRAGDRVFVIPLSPCGSCHVCEGGYGENYCPSSRFMASNAPGSLRSSYDYDAGLTIKLDEGLPPELAVFAEPMANVVQLLNELGFSRTGVQLDMKPFDKQAFSFFRVQGPQFSSIFNTIIEQEPNPRTLYVLSNADGVVVPTCRAVSQQGIMRKGLGLVGSSEADWSPVDYRRVMTNPRVLILGSGVSAFLMALVLRHVYGVPAHRLAVTGRTESKLDQFGDLDLAFQRLNVQGMQHDMITSNLTHGVGRTEKFDVVFELVGGDAVQKNVAIALDTIKRGGILAMFGLTDRQIEIDFGKLMDLGVYVRGSYRASLRAYRDALSYIAKHETIRIALETIIDAETEVLGHRGRFHEIHNESQLTEFFRAADKPRTRLGRMIIGPLSEV